MNRELMSLLDDMTVIETTYELIRKDFIYRIKMGDKWVQIKRTRADNLMWTHSVYTQAYDTVTSSFLPMIQVTNMRLSITEAAMVISQI